MLKTRQGDVIGTQPPGMSDTAPRPYLHSIPEASRILGVGRTMIYALMTSGRLRTVLIGSRRLVTDESLREVAAHGAADASARGGLRAGAEA